MNATDIAKASSNPSAALAVHVVDTTLVRLIPSGRWPAKEKRESPGTHILALCCSQQTGSLIYLFFFIFGPARSKTVRSVIKPDLKSIHHFDEGFYLFLFYYYYYFFFKDNNNKKNESVVVPVNLVRISVSERISSSCRNEPCWKEVGKIGDQSWRTRFN